MSLYPVFPVLLVDDEEHFLNSLSMLLRRKLFISNIRQCSDPSKVMSMMAAQSMSIVILDLTMPRISGESLLVKIKTKYPDTPVIILTGMDQLTTAVSCIKKGAYDYYVKTGNADRILQGIKRAIRLHELQIENRTLATGLLTENISPVVMYGNYASRSMRMIRIVRYMEAVASLSAAVLFVGEPGTGKYDLAMALHDLGGPGRPLLKVDAGAENVHRALIGGEGNQGKLYTAAGGTLVIRNIEFLSRGEQRFIMDVMDSGEFLPPGSNRTLPFSGRLIATSSLPLEDLQQQLPSLAMRFSPNVIQVPALRDRREDLPIILDHYLDEASRILGKGRPTVPPDLLAVLSAYHFPGNFNELREMIMEAVEAHSGGCVMSLSKFKEKTGASAVPSEENGLVSFTGSRLPTIEEIESLLLVEAERQASGNQSVMAGLLGLSRTAVNKRLKKLRNK